jgi:predicted NUDIX family NTP pyrophosphohydrolase
MFRRSHGEIEVLLVHPGGPHWANKNNGVWTMPKGESGDGEDSLIAAQREFFEETGSTSTGPFVSLGSVRQKKRKDRRGLVI